MALQENIIFSGVTCPRCGGVFFGEYPGPKTIFHCMRKSLDGTFCSGVACKCLTCNKVYPSTHFIERDGIYCCIHCNNAQLEYTKKMETNRYISSVHRRLEQIKKDMSNY